LRGARGETPVALLEHPRIPLISYPYEWTFPQLRDAALRHLELQLLALEHGFELSDASAYNMQFDQGLPLHVDVLSLRRYREGRPWEGYNQFCRQFLFPLLLESERGIPFQRWYRGQFEGIAADELQRLVPLRRRWGSLNLLLHLEMQARAIGRASSADLSGRPLRVPEIPRARYRAMLEGLHDWIARLRSRRAGAGYWAGYAELNSYAREERCTKLAFVQQTIRRWGCRQVLDVGGNSGDYSEAALSGGARRAWCLDSDLGALEAAYARRKEAIPGLLPLVVDWSDPSPAQGWASSEREALQQRLQPDAALALALVHHLVIGRNVPLDSFIDSLFAVTPRLIVEFVPHHDPMVQGLLRGREDIFSDYSRAAFEQTVEHHAVIEASQPLRDEGRILYACRRR
jgi:ribosomal protein L11 methylase PrmA